MNEEIEKLNEVLENLETLKSIILPAIVSNSNYITDLLTYTKELYDNQCSFVQSILNFQAKFLQLEERIKTVEGENKLIREEMGWK